MVQLELDFGQEDIEPMRHHPTFERKRPSVTINRAFTGWTYLLTELVRWEIPFEVQHNTSEEIEVTYGHNCTKEFEDILSEAYNLPEVQDDD